MKCDADIFARMYEAVYQDLYRFALCLLQDRHEAEDAVGEAVLAAYENIRKLRDEKAFKSWIFTILANVCRKKLRKRGLEISLDQEDTFFNIPTAQEDHGLSVDVKRAFLILSEEEQMIVALSVFGGYTSREIGKTLKLNENTVRSKRSRALEKMECVLE